MLGQEDFMVIQALVRRGVYVCDIARQLGVHPKTVSRAIARGSAPRRTGRPRGSRLDAFKPQVDALLAEGVWNAVVIFREIQTRGYTGRLSILRDYLRPKRALRPSRATVRFETVPGRQLQGDWGQIETVIAGVATTVHFVVHTLGYSRRFHFWPTDREDAEHTYEGLIRAFEWLGGVTAEVLVDNQKAAVLEHRPDGVRFNARFLDVAGHYGFTPRACRPARARTKGKDERMVGYVKHHFFVRYRAFDSWAHLEQLAEQWLCEEADQRIHGTVRERVADRFAVEAPALQPLPATRYDTSYWELRQVAWDAYVDVRGNRYSVPAALVGRRVSVRIGLDGALRVLDGETAVAWHQLRPAAAGWATVPEHHAPLWAAVAVEQRPLAVYEEVSQWN
jgi:transposase